MTLLQLGKRAAPSSDETVPAPFFAHLYVENRCHLRCKHCYEDDSTHPFKGTHLTPAQWAPIFDGLKDLGVMVLTFSGGEPFLRKDFDALLQMAADKRFSTRIYTAGTHIDDAWADRLQALQVGDVQVSLYSVDAAVHDGFTQHPGSWQKTIDGVRRLVARGVPTLLKVTVTTFNIDELDALCDLADDLGVKISFATQVFAKVSGDTSPLQFQVPSDELAAKFFANPRVSEVRDMFDKEDVCQGEAGFDGERRPCGAGEHIITIGADGDVYPCAIFSSSAGNAVRDDVREIWRDAQLLKQVRAFRMKDFAECPTCENSKTCAPCMAQSESNHGVIDRCNPGSRHTAVAKRLAVLNDDDAQHAVAMHPSLANTTMVAS